MNATSFQTSMYGPTSGQRYDIFDQGRITGIQDWGSNFDGPLQGILVHTWSSDHQTLADNPDKWGNDSIEVSCTPFTITSTQYIDGFRIITNNDRVQYLGFHISDGSTYSCAYSTTGTDTGWIILDNVQLIGFKIQIGNHLDAIGFQFEYIPDNTTFITPDYGADGGNRWIELFNIGSIRSITDWGYSNNWDNAIIIKSMNSESYTLENTLGSDSLLYNSCLPFTLSDGEYIDTYRIRYTDNYVVGLGFITSQVNVHECGVNTLAFTTGWIQVNNGNAYLSGMWVKWAWIIDSIALQFTQISPTANPTTAEPTLSPSTNSPTSFPSIYRYSSFLV